MQLTSTANVKSFAGISVSTYDTLLGLLIDGVSSYIENETGRTFASAAYTEYFNGGADEFCIKNRPIASTPAVVISYNNGTNSVPNWVAVSVDDIAVDYTTGLITCTYGHLPRGVQNVKIVYTGGYASSPADLELVCKQLVAKAFEQRKATGKTRESLGGASIDWKNTLDPEQASTLDKYKNIVI